MCAVLAWGVGVAGAEHGGGGGADRCFEGGGLNGGKSLKKGVAAVDGDGWGPEATAVVTAGEAVFCGRKGG